MVTRLRLARAGAPAALLLGITVAVLLVRAGLHGGATTPAGTLGPVTRATTPVQTTTPARTRPVTAFTTPAAAATPRYYVVQKGDSFGSIAARTGTTVVAIEALNPGVSSNALQVGQRIRVK